MPNLSVLTFAIADKAIGTRLDLQHVRKVLGTHGWLLHQHMGGANNVGHYLAGQGDLARRVDG